MPADQLLNQLVSDYYASRPNLDVPHSALCIFFLACSGSGKSTTRRILVEKLQATYVCNDEVRLLLEKYPDAKHAGIEIKDIVAATVKKILTGASNKFVIYDNNIIRYYMHADSYLNVAKRNNYPVFIIGLEAPEEELRKRIIERGINVAQILGELPGQILDYEKAKDDLPPDHRLTLNFTDKELDLLMQQINRVSKR